MSRKKDILVIGLALFAMFFGAGNLIFPPYLGMIASKQWIIGFISFMLADVGLAMVAIIAMIKGDGSISGVTGRIGKIPSFLLNTAIIICVGPLLAIPRTAATTFEMTVLPILPDSNTWFFSIIFFTIALFLTIRPSKVVDIIGKFLTPLMFVALAVLIIKGIVTPLGPISPEVLSDNVMREGVITGYQSMDALGALAFAIIIISAVTEKGYTEEKDKMKMVISASLVAGLGLCLVFLGLTYLGATVSTVYTPEVNQAALLVAITKSLLGQPGVIMLGVIVGLACLTTAVGLTSACAAYFEKVSNGKLKYEVIVCIVIGFSAVVSNFGISTIIGIAVPILNIVYPAVIALVFLSFFKNKIKGDSIYKGVALFVFLISAVSVLKDMNLPIKALDLVERLPLFEYGFQWILPAIVGGVIGCFFQGKSKEDIAD